MTTRFLQVTRITSDPRSGFHTDTDEPGEPQAPPPVTTACTIAVDAIRCFYPRKDNRPGTRITFKDGGGFAVTEAYDDLVSLLVLVDASTGQTDFEARHQTAV